MSRYVLTQKAVHDITEIWNFTRINWGEKQADEYYQELIDTFQFLSSSPAIGRNYDHIYDKLRGFLVLKHVIFYSITSVEIITIVRILHSRMDLKNKIDS